MDFQAHVEALIEIMHDHTCDRWRLAYYVDPGTYVYSETTLHFEQSARRIFKDSKTEFETAFKCLESEIQLGSLKKFLTDDCHMIVNDLSSKCNANSYVFRLYSKMCDIQTRLGEIGENTKEKLLKTIYVIHNPSCVSNIFSIHSKTPVSVDTLLIWIGSEITHQAIVLSQWSKPAIKNWLLGETTTICPICVCYFPWLHICSYCSYLLCNDCYNKWNKQCPQCRAFSEKTTHIIHDQKQCPQCTTHIIHDLVFIGSEEPENEEDDDDGVPWTL